jgi:Fic family protein
LSSPLLYLSLAFKRHRQEYYDRLTQVRTRGDWEGWTAFFLECVRESAEDAVDLAGRLFRLMGRDREVVLRHKAATIPAVRLFDLLPERPMISLAAAVDLMKTTKPTAAKAINALVQAGVIREITGRRRDRIYAYHAYLSALADEACESKDS